MAKLRAGVIGCGGRGQGHALGYHQSDKVDLVACADVHGPAAERLAAAYQVPRIYADYKEMLEKEKLDIVTMALWPDLHCKAVLDCVQCSHPPRLINAEKPMAPTYGESVRMHKACQKAGIMLTFSHQRRFGPSFRKAKELLKAGAIGDLIKMDAYCPNLFDWGTHWFDMMLFFVDNAPVDWVMGQVDCPDERRVFGAFIEGSGLSYLRWANGVCGMHATGPNPGGFFGLRLTGTKGLIEVGEQHTRVLREGYAWETPALEKIPVRGGDTALHILDSVTCLVEGRESILCSRNALQTTELIFATYESARRREKVFLPLKTDDSALLTLVKDGGVVIPSWPAFVREEEQKEGYELLFNGSDLSGWRAVHSPAAWSVDVGLLRAKGKGTGWLLTDGVFGDFVLRLEFRLWSRSYSGVILRAPDRGNPVSDALVIPIRDDRGDEPTTSTSGAVLGAVPPTKSQAHGGSSWNALQITCRGSQVEVILNGERVQDCDLALSAVTAGKPLQGHLGLHVPQGKADFRAVRIRRLQ